jgi:hypothetical protein
MTTPEMYSLEEIRNEMLTKRVVGSTSPAVRRQNELITRLIAVGAEQAGPAILGAHLIGSRAHGSAGLDSDADLAIFTYYEQKNAAHALARRLRNVLLPASIEADGLMGAMYTEIFTGIHAEPAEFVYKLRAHPPRATGLYEIGAYDTPGLRLAALAANEVIMSLGNDTQPAWDNLRRGHAEAYLGDRSRVCAKLAGRLALPLTEVESTITYEVWQERTAKFSLPPNFADHYAAGQECWRRSRIFRSNMRVKLLCTSR